MYKSDYKNIIYGNLISREIQNEIKTEVLLFKQSRNIIPSLAVILVGDNDASRLYVKNKQRMANYVGIQSKLFELPIHVEQKEIINIIEDLNEDPTIHGILVQLPLPSQIDETTVISMINPLKDVDGLHPYNSGLLAAGIPKFVPATPLAIREILLRTNNNPAGKHVVILGRSNIVGRPVANLLSLKSFGGNATVTLCHSRTNDLKSLTKTADIIIVAMGIPNFVDASMVHSGVVVIDVGINRIPNLKMQRGYKLVGDVDFESVMPISSAITPVPGGVGPMTIAMLLSNTILATKLQDI
jgi:methylenetetrahydrofolate dehydrogenase (NADP+)/methenyltetrahydrofolate cyclohydrolase